MTSRLPAAARREQLLDVALTVFARHGYHGTAMNDIAESAGVTKPVLYQHFASKRQLYLALLEAVGDRVRTAISKATAEALDPKTQTEMGFRAYFRWVADDHDGFRLLFGGDARRDPEFDAAVSRVTDEIADALAPTVGAELGERYQQTLAYALVGLTEGVSRHLVQLDVGFDPDDVARHTSELAWAGLRALR